MVSSCIPSIRPPQRGTNRYNSITHSLYFPFPKLVKRYTTYYAASQRFFLFVFWHQQKLPSLNIDYINCSNLNPRILGESMFSLLMINYKITIDQNLECSGKQGSQMHGFQMKPQSCSGPCVNLRINSRSSRNNFNKFCRNTGLTGTVILECQRVNHFARILRRVLHSSHSG